MLLLPEWIPDAAPGPPAEAGNASLEAGFVLGPASPSFERAGSLIRPALTARTIIRSKNLAVSSRNESMLVVVVLVWCVRSGTSWLVGRLGDSSVNQIVVASGASGEARRRRGKGKFS
mmetsp:Transcript_12486/g.28833  ORF Transcript_12486/g.28833 Transcript_12486/m.28833 type:complete len:118 (-) Transcript_12486:301-654(-)